MEARSRTTIKFGLEWNEAEWLISVRSTVCGNAEHVDHDIGLLTMISTITERIILRPSIILPGYHAPFLSPTRGTHGLLPVGLEWLIQVGFNRNRSAFDRDSCEEDVCVSATSVVRG